jgi:outer membrane receptor protein involved in Fe transport
VRAVHHKSNWDAPGFLNLNSILAGTVKPTDRDPTAPPLWGNAKRSSLVFTRLPAQGEAGLHVSTYIEDYFRTRALGANPTDLNIQTDDRWIMGVRALENVVIGDRAGIAFGAELRRDRGDAIHHRWPAGAPGPNYTFNQDLSLLTYGVFAQGQIRPRPALKLLGGFRVDRFDYAIKNRKLPAASLDYNQSAVTPRAGIVWSPVRTLDLFANVGEGIRSPNQTEISPSGNVGPLGATGGRAFPDLKPPKVRSYDFGATLLGGERWGISAAKYHTINENEIIAVAPGVFESAGNTTRAGWEVESRMAAGEQLILYGSYGRINKAKINIAAPGAATRAFCSRTHRESGRSLHNPAHNRPRPRQCRPVLHFGHSLFCRHSVVTVLRETLYAVRHPGHV